LDEETGRNKTRDKLVNRELRKMGWIVVRVWEHELNKQPKNKGLKKVGKKIEKDALPRMKKYEEQERMLAGRNSYSRTEAICG
jgi:G:T-mismatch repair DNA endonuclease (very short patch repair protein)